MLDVPARVLALVAVLVALAPAAVLLPTAAAQGTPPPVAQTITVESPPPGTQVGSPMVVTGTTARLPASASLTYVVRASDGRTLGSGSFPVPGNPGQPAYFLTSLTFEEPREGDAITLQLIDQDPATGAILGVAALSLVTAPLPQRIIVETPGQGTRVGNPVVVTGRTVRFPAAGVLGFAVYDSFGAQVGGGVFPVAGSVQEGGRFSASLGFLYPPLGGPLRVDLYDQDPVTGAFPATASIEFTTVALVQQITIETPAFGTRVGSPVVLTGRATLVPAGGALQYRISDAQGATLGAGSFPVQPAPDASARFVASLAFQPPPIAGIVRAQVFETDAAGRVIASAIADMRWEP